MPDHLHLLIEATSERADLVAFAAEAKQRTAYRYRRRHAQVLWQKGYYEQVLRDDEATLTVARYILANPVRAGLVEEPGDYPFAGSFVFNRLQLEELWQSAERRSVGTP